MKELFKAGLDLLLPPSCPYCRKMLANTDSLLCGECFSRLEFIKPPYCACCGRAFLGGGENHLCGDCLKSSWAFDKARSLFAYGEVVAGLIHNLKYSGKTTGIATIGWLSRQSGVVNDLDDPDFILPVPLHIKRLRQRGFNQAHMLAKTIFPDGRKKIRSDFITRQADTPAQTGLSGRERRKNLKNAFVIEKACELTGRNVLIFDDVFTTGSTVNECANALRTAGVKRVEVLTICRADMLLF